MSENDAVVSKTSRKKRAASAEKKNAASLRKPASKKKEDETIVASLRTNGAGAPEAGASARSKDMTAAASMPAPSSAGSFSSSSASASASQSEIRKPDAARTSAVSREERHRMIAEAAYHKSLLRHPGTGNPQRDWYEAEAEIDALLAEQRTERTQ